MRPLTIVCAGVVTSPVVVVVFPISVVVLVGECFERNVVISGKAENKRVRVRERAQRNICHFGGGSAPSQTPWEHSSGPRSLSRSLSVYALHFASDKTLRLCWLGFALPN